MYTLIVVSKCVEVFSNSTHFEKKRVIFYRARALPRGAVVMISMDKFGSCIVPWQMTHAILLNHINSLSSFKQSFYNCDNYYFTLC